MSRLIESLLTNARSAGSGALRLQPVIAAVHWGTAMQNLQVLIEEAGALVTSNLLPEVNAEEGLLAQLFQNLIGNSLRYWREGVVLEVQATAKRQNEDYVFHV